MNVELVSSSGIDSIDLPEKAPVMTERQLEAGLHKVVRRTSEYGFDATDASAFLEADAPNP